MITTVSAYILLMCSYMYSPYLMATTGKHNPSAVLFQLSAKVPTKFSLELLVARNSKPHNHRFSPSLLVPHWQICIRMYMTVCSAFELQVKTHWSSSTANTARAVTSSDLVLFSVSEVVPKMLWIKKNQNIFLQIKIKAIEILDPRGLYSLSVIRHWGPVKCASRPKTAGIDSSSIWSWAREAVNKMDGLGDGVL